MRRTRQVRDVPGVSDRPPLKPEPGERMFNLATYAWDEPVEMLVALAPAHRAHLVMPRPGAVANGLGHGSELPRRRRHALVKMIDEALHLGRDVSDARIHHLNWRRRNVPVAKNALEPPGP